jgi:hypothetical protein
MFDQILQLVKEHMAENPQVAAQIPPEQADAVHQEIAAHLTNGLQNAGSAGGAGNVIAPGGIGGGGLAGLGGMTGGGLLSQLEGSLASGNILTSSIAGGLVGSLGSKFGLGPAATGAIAAALPGLLQRFTQRQ